MKSALSLITNFLSPPASPSKVSALSSDDDGMMSEVISPASRSMVASPPISPASSPCNGDSGGGGMSMDGISDEKCQAAAEAVLKTPELRPQATEWVPSFELSGSLSSSSSQLSYASSEDESVDSCEPPPLCSTYDDHLVHLSHDSSRDAEASEHCLTGGYSYKLHVSMLQQIALELRPQDTRSATGSLRIMAGMSLSIFASCCWLAAGLRRSPAPAAAS